ncbi:orotate phosphoribosyltransferase [Alkalicoccobacillus murimartini]|uniref:Orotate phosphoribosyltransferase n=1 Tax=Alkalicoccobacillus murimartini TaxID=171685 RepID=A0ABT9YFV3_9BACI|nr:orotate phosphoribosyltransferase [Alkalicoccobacillus murimartini]MDQ0206416.1 orotate phosphoribosyltransferase [Alkalicoccobacillus murimartini]
MTTKTTVAEKLLSIGAVSLKPSEPFTWSSGMKSPIYCDNRLTLSFPAVRQEIAKGLADLIKTHYPDVDVIAGTATAGIPHAAWVSDLLDLPMIYVRGSAKGHGKQKRIEGKLEAGQKVVVIEDLISTGGSSLSAVDAIREDDGVVLGVAAIFTYELQKALDNLNEYNIEAQVLTDYTTLIQVAKDTELISEREQTMLSQWRKNPQSEEWMTE